MNRMLSKLSCIILVLFATFLCTKFAWSSSWVDPSWEELIKESELIVLAEVNKSGANNSKFTLLKILKGDIEESHIWVAGHVDATTLMSNKESEIKHDFIVGKRFYLFLRKYTKKNQYEVWTPSAGIISVEGDKARYDLLQVSWQKNRELKSEQELKEFLEYSIDYHSNNVINDSYLSKLDDLLNKSLTPNSKLSSPAQYIMMLLLSGNKHFYPTLKKTIQHKQPETRLALAQQLGKINKNSSTILLTSLVADKNSIVQGEAVRQLKNRDSKYVGSVLLKNLEHSGEEGLYRGNIMNPVFNTVDGGKIEIVRALGDLGYKPAIEKLMGLIATNNIYLLGEVIHSLEKLGVRDYRALLGKRAGNGEIDSLDICEVFKKYNIEEAIYGLQNYLVNADEEKMLKMEEWNIYKHALSCLSYSTGVDLAPLVNKFRKIVENKIKLESIWQNKRSLYISYIEMFSARKMTSARPYIQKAIYEWYGFDRNFLKKPALFRLKKKLERDLENEIRKSLTGYDVTGIGVVSFIQNSNDLLVRDSIEPKYSAEIVVKMHWDKNRYQKASTEMERKQLNKEIFNYIHRVKKILEKDLNNPNLYVSVHQGASVTNFSHYFDVGIGDIRVNEWMFNKYLEYAKEFPDDSDVDILLSLHKNNFFSVKSYISNLDKFAEKIKYKIRK